MDTHRTQQITMAVLNGNRDACETDEERRLYDRIKWEYDDAKADGFVFDLIHDSDG